MIAYGAFLFSVGASPLGDIPSRKFKHLSFDAYTPIRMAQRVGGRCFSFVRKNRNRNGADQDQEAIPWHTSWVTKVLKMDGF